MKIRFPFFLVLFMAFLDMRAIPAYPYRTSVVVGNDTVWLTLHGDECCKYATTSDGYTVLQDDKECWYYATVDKNGYAICSDFALKSEISMDESTVSFLANQRKGIIPQKDLMSNDSKYFLRSKPQSRKIQSVIGPRRILVILLEFRDLAFKKSAEDFNNLFNQPNYREDGAIGSVRDYYDYVSYGQLQLQCDILGPYQATRKMAYYGGNSSAGGKDMNHYQMFLDAIEHVSQDVQLSDYDADGDGYVDNVHIIFAGYGEEAGASSNAIWSHESTFPAITVQDMKIDRYSCAPELRGNMGEGISRIGPHCHEIGHALGAMDYYDTDYETGGSYLGTGQWDIMADGSWNREGVSPANFNPYVKIYNFGWVNPLSLMTDTLNVVSPSNWAGNIYRINTSDDKDFFLVENRTATYFDAASPGKGLLVYHIGPAISEKERTNTINATFPQQCYLVCASSYYAIPSKTPYSYGKVNSDGCPFPGSKGKSDFNDMSTPSTRTINGENTGISLTDIHHEKNNIVFFYQSVYEDANASVDVQNAVPKIKTVQGGVLLVYPHTVDYAVYDFMGRTVSKGLLQKDAETMVPLNSGIYVLRIGDDSYKIQNY